MPEALCVRDMRKGYRYKSCRERELRNPRVLSILNTTRGEERKLVSLEERVGLM